MTAGLRERKKQQTREHISNVATTLFARQGFEATTIAEVAAAADVAKMTVTNYFPLKEDLVFDRHEQIAALLADAVTGREPGVGAFQAVRDTHLRHIGARNPVLGFIGPAFGRMVAASPALLTREREMLAAQEDRLAEALAAEFASSYADVRPRLAAVQLAGLVRILYYDGRRRLLEGEPVETIVAAVRRAARAGYAAVGPTLPPAYLR